MDHREACLLLADYVKGELRDDELRAVAEHIAGHAECARTVDFLKKLQSDIRLHAVEDELSHPSADELVAYAAGALEDLDDDTQRLVMLHLATCGECHEHAAVATRVHGETSMAEVGVIRSGPSARLRLMTGLALAAGVAIGLLIPQTSDIPDPGGPAPILKVFGDERGGAVEPFIVAGSAVVVPVAVFWDPWAGHVDRMDYEIVAYVLDGAGEIRWSMSMSAMASWNRDEGFVSFLVPADQLAGGWSRLVIRDESGADLFSGSFLSSRPQ